MEKTNLMVFIHPVILRDAAVTDMYTNNKYNYIRSLQLGQDEDGINLMPDANHPALPTLDEFSGASVPPAEPASAGAPAVETAPPGEDEESDTVVHDSFRDN